MPEPIVRRLDDDHGQQQREVLQPELVGDRPGNHGPPPTVGVEPSAIKALVLAIASWVIIPVVGGLAALLLGMQAKRRIRHSQGNLVGHGVATAAQVIGGVNVVLGVAIVWLIVQIFHWLF